MGKTKLKVFDDSTEDIDRKKKPPKEKAVKEAKLESDKASDEVEHTSESNDSTEDEGAKQISSERTGDASDALRPSEPTIEEAKEKKKTQKVGKAKPRSKKYQEASKDLDRTKSYSLEEAVDMVKKMSYAKFNATVEAHINTHVLGLRGFISLPFASGKKLRILAFGKGAEGSGATLVGTDATLEDIEKGKVDFDLIVTTPEWMSKLAKAAKILGPKGLMPSPKSGTITDDLKKTVESFQAGKTEYKTEAKAPIIHMALGKVSQPNEELLSNIKILLATLGKTKIKKVSLASTMGPSVKIDLASI